MARRYHEIEIRLGKQADLPQLKILVDENRKELGFITKAQLAAYIDRGSLFVAEIGEELIGFVGFWRRRDGQVTLHVICVRQEYRRNGVGRRLMKALEESSEGWHLVVLKCPIDLEANKFYSALGFSLVGIESGKRRDLKVWQKQLG